MSFPQYLEQVRGGLVANHRRRQLSGFGQPPQRRRYRVPSLRAHRRHQYLRREVVRAALAAPPKVHVRLDLGAHRRQALGSEIHFHPPVVPHTRSLQYGVGVRLQPAARPVGPPGSWFRREGGQRHLVGAGRLDQIRVQLTDRQEVPQRPLAGRSRPPYPQPLPGCQLPPSKQPRRLSFAWR